MKKLIALLIAFLIAIVIYNQLTTVKMDDFNRLRLTVDTVKRNTDTIKAELREVKKEVHELKQNTDTLKQGQRAIFESMEENNNKTLWDYLNI